MSPVCQDCWLSYSVSSGLTSPFYMSHPQSSSSVHPCPQDGILDTLEDWTACMTWTLDNGTVVLSNFVMEDEECSASRLEYWGQQYLPIVWNSTGTAECCTEDGCNDDRQNTTTASLAPSTTKDATTVMDTTTTSEDTVTTLEPVAAHLAEVDCTECRTLEHSQCLALPRLGEREDFQEMVRRVAAQSRAGGAGQCVCREGFLALRKAGRLVRCVDPILQTAALGGRCLVQKVMLLGPLHLQDPPHLLGPPHLLSHSTVPLCLTLSVFLTQILLSTRASRPT